VHRKCRNLVSHQLLEGSHWSDPKSFGTQGKAVDTCKNSALLKALDRNTKKQALLVSPATGLREQSQCDILIYECDRSWIASSVAGGRYG
jgi:hypothetical protein